MFHCQSGLAVRWNSSCRQIVTELCDIATSSSPDSIGQNRVLPSKGCRDIHKLREHGNADPGSNGKLASIQIAFNDRVVQTLHPGLPGSSKARDASDSGRDLSAFSALRVQRVHGLERLIALDSLSLQLLAGMAVAKDVFDSHNGSNSNRNG